jgi:carboxyl-terminal processing protease
MLQKGRTLVFFLSAVVVAYGLMAAFYGRVVAKDEAYKELAVFMDALKKVNEDYVESPDMNRVQDGAMRGMIDALDPYSSFFTKAQYDALQKRRAAGTAGAGMVLSKRANVIFVVSVQKGGPAEAAGIRPGDYVMALDGAGVEDKSILEAESLLRGAPDSKLKVSVFRGARTKPLDIEIVRKEDMPAAPAGHMLDDGIGVLQVPSLAGSILNEARVKLKTLTSAGAQKLILDLRDCADGETQSGAELANLFLKDGVIYYCQNRRGERTKEVSAAPKEFVTDMPMVVLINESTAGAAEVAAGALKDHKRAVLVGEKSFGVGSIQDQIALRSGAVLFLSTAKIFTPDGKMIQDEAIRNAGIKPDVEAPDDETQQDLMVEAIYDTKEDIAKYRELQQKIQKEQMDRAIEVLAKGAVPLKKAA